MKCLFCSIAKKEIPAEIVYENDETMAFLDINPRAPGDTLIISKSHAENILELKDEDISPVFLTVKKITGILSKALKPDGFTTGINHGRSSGQIIDHLHVHIMPRFEGDGGKSMHAVVNNPPQESLEEIAKKIKSCQ